MNCPVLHRQLQLGALRWIADRHADLTSGDPEGIGAGISGAVDVATLFVGALAGGKGLLKGGVDDLAAPTLVARVGQPRLNAAEALQRITTEQAERLAANPSLAATVLSPAAYRAGQTSSRVARMEYGHAIERLVAAQVERMPELDELFLHVGGPGRPDFIGRGGYTGLNFDITTRAQFLANSKAGRAYAPGLIQPTYTRPGDFYVFP